ncbi:hypothetical protein SH528x_007327 [Novipirellula sp. SH528]|uniref:hypothetical protein n=1 Tax=Novipirellula sp. SH528 TaxID=3454466 RepID=UPI003F9F08A0
MPNQIWHFKRDGNQHAPVPEIEQKLADCVLQKTHRTSVKIVGGGECKCCVVNNKTKFGLTAMKTL